MPEKQNLMPMNTKAMEGFTLIELMIVLVILSILLFVAVPNYDSVINDSKLDKVRHNIATGAALARVEAVQRGENVSFCRGASGACGAAVDTDWTGDGWKVRDTDEIIRVDDSQNSGVTVAFSCGETLIFNSLGGSESGDCEFSFTVASETVYLCVASTGRVRMSDGSC